MVAIDGRTKLVGLLGFPIEHTLSPAMHNAAFSALGLNYCYLPLPVPPEMLGDAVNGLAAMGFVGANVTIPHKQNVMACLDELSDEARAIGAREHDRAPPEQAHIGRNMDGPGFLEALNRNGITVNGTRTLVLGAGGAARAVVFTLLKAGSAVTILNRTVSRAEALAEDLRPHAGGVRLSTAPLDAEVIAALAPEFDLVVNTTSIGMTPHEEGDPWPVDVLFPAKCHRL